MSKRDSALDPAKLALARALLAPPITFVNIWAPLAAAGALAVASLAFATAMIMSPPTVSQHVAGGVK